MNQKVRVAFVGAGPTTHEHVKSFLDISDVLIVGIFNRTFENAEKLAEKYDISQIFSSLEELYEIGKPDLVVVCVYETAKLEVMTQCLSYGIPILAEKPIALHYEESLKIADMAIQYHCPTWIALNRRSYSSTRLAVKKLDLLPNNKRIIEVTDQQDLRMIRQLGHSESVIRNWMYANSIHLVDYFSIFARGKLESMKIMTPWDSAKPGFVSAHLKFTSQDEGIYKAYWNAPSPWSCSVNNGETHIELKPLEKINWQESGSRNWATSEPDEWDQKFKPGFRFQAQESIKAIRGELHSLCDIQNALQSIDIIKKIYNSKEGSV